MINNQTYHRQLIEVSPVRQRIMGIVFLLFAAAILIFFIFGQDLIGKDASFGLTPGGVTPELAPLIVAVEPALYIMAVICAIAGGYQLARGFKRLTNWMLGLVVGFFILAFLTWAAAGKSLNMAGLLATTLGKAVPLTLGAMSGILCERAGVFNIAIEGMMLSSAMIGCLVSSLIKNVSHITYANAYLWIGLIAAIATGAIMAIIHGVLSIKYKVNQIISGTIINILSTGFSSYISAKFLQPYPDLNTSGIFPPWAIPGLSSIPFIGPILFRNTLFVYAMFVFLIILSVALFKTRWGLRMRSVGEHPKAADTLGINVIRTRYMAVILSGMMAGFAGAYFTLGSVGRFDEVMTAGRGFIALAAMIFGNWMPFGAFGAGLLFGFADALATRLTILQIRIPSEFMLMAPYVATMIVLAGVVGRGQPPAAGGIPYEKE
jgi:ABC-type uncharacterized transport system permease subunit